MSFGSINILSKQKWLKKSSRKTNTSKSTSNKQLAIYATNQFKCYYRNFGFKRLWNAYFSMIDKQTKVIHPVFFLVHYQKFVAVPSWFRLPET